MGLRDVSTTSLKSHVEAMLCELADWVETSQDPSLGEVAIRLRLLSADPALRTADHDFEEVLLACDQSRLRLIKRTRVSGSLRLMPTFRLESDTGDLDLIDADDLSDEKAAVAAFMSAQLKRRLRH